MYLLYILNLFTSQQHSFCLNYAYSTVPNCGTCTGIFFDKKSTLYALIRYLYVIFYVMPKKSYVITATLIFRIFHPITLIPYYRAIRYRRVVVSPFARKLIYFVLTLQFLIATYTRLFILGFFQKNLLNKK